LYDKFPELFLFDRIGLVFFEMVWEASECDFTKKQGRKKRIMNINTDTDGRQNKCEDACEPWNALYTAKLKEVMQAGHDAFAWQTRQDTLAKQKSANIDQWLKSRQIARRPLVWDVCYDAYMRFKTSYKAAHDGKPSFGVRRFEIDNDD